MAKSHFSLVYDVFGFSPGGYSVIRDGKEVFLLSRSTLVELKILLSVLNAQHPVFGIDRVEII